MSILGWLLASTFPAQHLSASAHYTLTNHSKTQLCYYNQNDAFAI